FSFSSSMQLSKGLKKSDKTFIIIYRFNTLRRLSVMIPYKHEPFTDFSLEENRTKLQEGLKTVKYYLRKDYPRRTGGDRIMTDEKTESESPAEKTETIGHMSQAGRQHVQQAMDAALEPFGSWRKSTFEFRSAALFKAAAIIRKRKFEFT